MSECGDNKIPTNEELIDDLTNDLDSRCKTGEDNLESIGDMREEICNDIDKREDDGEIKDDDSIDDFIDEDLLKQDEINLSKEEKLARNKEAIELKSKGNDAFKKCDYLESLKIYTKALRLCPVSYESDRSILYANRAASKGKLDRKLSAIDDCTKAIELNSTYVRAYLRRAKFYEETEKYSECLEDYKKVLELDPSVPEARAATVRLPPLIEEQNEKLKTEMLGKMSIIYLYFVVVNTNACFRETERYR